MKISFTVLLNFIVIISFTQDIIDPAKQKSISLNIVLSQFKDENLHPGVFRGTTISASYIHSKIARNISEYSIGLNISALKTKYEEFPSALGLLIHGNYKYIFSVFSNEKLNYNVGPLFSFQYGTNAYFNWDESHLYYANFISGGISGRLNYKTDLFHLVFNLDVPLLSAISRPVPNRQFKIDDMTFSGIIKNLAGNPEFASLNKNFYMKAGLEMQLRTRKMKIRSIGYSLLYHYMEAQNGAPYRNVENSIIYKFIF